jgi:hypothetical protein
LILASLLKAFQLYLSIKYTALLSFLFSCVSFFLFYLSIYQLVHAPFLSPLSLPYPIPSSSDFFSFFLSLLPSLSPQSYPAIPFFNPPPFSMDDTQTAFATQYPPYGFDLDMMKVRLFPRNFFFIPTSLTLIPLAASHGYCRWSRRQKGPLVAQFLCCTHR